MNNLLIHDQIMDLRDTRVRLQRQIATLNSMELWTPWAFTTAHAQQLDSLKTQVQNIKLREQTLKGGLCQ